MFTKAQQIVTKMLFELKGEMKMHKFEVVFYTNIVTGTKIDNRRKVIYQNYEGESLDSILESVQTGLDNSNWIMDKNGKYYRTTCVTDFTIHDLGLAEELE